MERWNEKRRRNVRNKIEGERYETISLSLSFSLPVSVSNPLFIHFPPSVFVSVKCIRKRKDKRREREAMEEKKWSTTGLGGARPKEGGAG